MTGPIYLDNSTTTQPSERAISAMMPYWTTYWGNSSAPHQKGQELNAFIGEHYKVLYTALGANEEDQLVLTSSGAEAINHVIASTYRDQTLTTGKNHFLTGALDEAASIMAVGRLASFGCIEKMVEVDKNGLITVQAVADRLSARTALLSLSWANGLTGVIQPLADIASLCKERGVKLHIDATHVIGKVYYENLDQIGADFVTLNGDHLHAPKGSGLLWIKRGVACSPFIFGSADQAGMRAGALNMAALAGLAYAVKESIDSRDFICTETARLRYQLEKGILEACPEAKICFRNQERLPTCTTILFPRIANEALLFMLNRKGVYASIGGGHFQQLGLMLASTGIDSLLAHSAISFSLSRYTTEKEIDSAILIIAECVHALTKLSPSQV